MFDDLVGTEPTKAGFVGSGSILNGVESIILTVDIDGRSDASVCVHKNPTEEMLAESLVDIPLPIKQKKC